MTLVCPSNSVALIPERVASRIFGRLHHAVSGLPLVGLQVNAAITGAPHSRGNDGNDLLLGEAISDEAGRFVIMLANKPEAGRALAHLVGDKPVSIVFKVLEPQTNALYLTSSSFLLAKGTLFVDLSVPLLAPVIAASLWSDWATRLQNAGVYHFNEIIRSLLVAAPGTAFSDWSLTQRHSVIQAMEAALLDADGILRAQGSLPSLSQLHGPNALRDLCAHLGDQAPEVRAAFIDLKSLVDSFDDLLKIDWSLDISAAANGDIHGVLRRARERYRAMPAPTPPNAGGQ